MSIIERFLYFITFNYKQKNTIQNFLNYQKQKSPKNDWDEYDLLAFDDLIERWKD